MLFDNHSRTFAQNVTSRRAGLSLSTSARKEYGNSLDSALNIGRLKRSKSYKFDGNVGGSSDLDYFRFKADKGLNLTLELTNDSRDEPIAITLLNGKGRPIKDKGKFLFKNIEAGDTETISLPLPFKGAFFVRIQSAKGRNENYSFRLNTSETTPDSTIDSAKDLGTLTLGDSVSELGSVGKTDIDYYKFDINDMSRIRAELTNDSSNEPIAFTVLDRSGNPFKTQNGRFLFANVEAGEDAELLAPTLPAGTYYLRAQSADGDDEEYSFKLTQTAITTPI